MEIITELTAATRLVIAALVGLGIGLEREWSGHASGPEARFAGLRTFLLLGTTGGVGGLLLSAGFEGSGTAVIVGGMALSVGAYVMTTYRASGSIDGTTEAAALATVGLGAIAGVGWIALAAGAGSMIVLALREKSRLHWFVGRVSEVELRAALQFAVLALVILPLLPAGPYLGVLDVRPRALWAIVLFFSALNFAAFLARRAAGPSAGYTLTGLLGGLLSSTAVTLEFARQSRRDPVFGTALGYGVIAACTVLIPRIVAVSMVLNRAVGLRLAWMLMIPAVCGALMLGFGWRRQRTDAASEVPRQLSPLRLVSAIKMAVAFQVAVTGIALVRQAWGTLALYPTAALLGLTDVDALTFSMSRVDGDVDPTIAARAIVLGVIANTMLKLTFAFVIGSGRFRSVAVIGLVVLALVTAGAQLVPLPNFGPVGP